MSMQARHFDQCPADASASQPAAAAGQAAAAASWRSACLHSTAPLLPAPLCFRTHEPPCSTEVELHMRHGNMNHQHFSMMPAATCRIKAAASCAPQAATLTYYKCQSMPLLQQHKAATSAAFSPHTPRIGEQRPGRQHVPRLHRRVLLLLRLLWRQLRQEASKAKASTCCCCRRPCC